MHVLFEDTPCKVIGTRGWGANREPAGTSNLGFVCSGPEKRCTWVAKVTGEKTFTLSRGADESDLHLFS